MNLLIWTSMDMYWCLLQVLLEEKRKLWNHLDALDGLIPCTGGLLCAYHTEKIEHVARIGSLEVSSMIGSGQHVGGEQTHDTDNKEAVRRDMRTDLRMKDNVALVTKGVAWSATACAKGVQDKRNTVGCVYITIVHVLFKEGKIKASLARKYIACIRSPFSYTAAEPSITELLVRPEMRCVLCVECVLLYVTLSRLASQVIHMADVCCQ